MLIYELVEVVGLLCQARKGDEVVGKGVLVLLVASLLA